VPDTSTAKLDYVKLALLLGDERVLNEFGRAANTYAASALNKIRVILQGKPQAATEVLEKMRGHMEALATKVIHTGETSKYTSINTKGNYVEFRSPGGDYLDANWELVVPTLLRTVVALDAAMDPEKYRQEYQKKLYKLLDSSKQRSTSPSVNKLLSMYFASDNEANSREVAVKLAKEILSRKDLEKQVGTPGKQFWWSVQKGNDRIEVVAGTEGVALDVAAEEWGLSGADRMPNATATILRPYVAPPAQTDDGRWGIWISDADKFTVGDGKVRRWASKQDAELWLKLRRESQPNTRRDLEVREIPDDYQQPSRAGSAQSAQFQEPNATSGDLTPRGPGPWEIYRISDSSSVRNLEQTNRMGAESEARAALGLRGEAPELYAVRTRAAAAAPLPDLFPEIPRAPAAAPDFSQMGSNTTGQHRYQIIRMSDRRQVGEFNADTQAEAELHAHMVLGNAGLDSEDYDVRQAPPELIDVPLDMEIVQAPRTLTTPGQPQQTFTGEWKIVSPNGEEIHRFGGIGNAQADANRVAIEWLRRNPGQMQAGVEVVPVMAE
jgi:hypothetical protein